MTKQNRLSLALRILLLAAVGAASSACYFDGHFGHCHSHHHCAPVRICR